MQWHKLHAALALALHSAGSDKFRLASIIATIFDQYYSAQWAAACALVLLCCSSWGDSHCSKYFIIVQFHHAFSSLARQSCTAALPGSSTNFDLTVLQWQVTKLHARAVVLTGLNLF
jgi:hypothetical protein